MSDVRCTGRKCAGALHSPDCEMYLLAMKKFQADRESQKKVREDKRRNHMKKDPSTLLSPEERARIRKESGWHRKLGTKNVLPLGMVKMLKEWNKSGGAPSPEELKAASAVVTGGRTPGRFRMEQALRSYATVEPAARALALKGLNVRKEMDDDAKQVAGFTFVEMVAIAAGVRGIKKGRVQLAAIEAVRKELCNPIETKATMDVNMTNMVLAAQKIAVERTKK